MESSENSSLDELSLDLPDILLDRIAQGIEDVGLREQLLFYCL